MLCGIIAHFLTGYSIARLAPAIVGGLWSPTAWRIVCSERPLQFSTLHKNTGTRNCEFPHNWQWPPLCDEDAAGALFW